MEWGADELHLSDKPSYDMILRRLLLAGDFLDIIFDHPETIHELVVDADLSKILKELKPHLKNMLYYLFLRDYSTLEYAKRYDWLIKEFTDWAFTFMTSFLYYMDYDTIDEQTRSLYRQDISAFGGIAPTYRIALEKDSPVIVWDFHSLLIMVQMCFSFMLTDKDSDMRMCKHCKKAFVASRKGNEFFSQKCKNQYNVYKSREKKKGNKTNP